MDTTGKVKAPVQALVSVFVSKLEELMKAKEFRFDATPGFGFYKPFFPKDAVAHPAKMNTAWLEYLVKTYTKEGETVLDPMGGTGSTGVISAYNGRNAVIVELEDKFVRMEREAAEKLQDRTTVNSKGSMRVFQGDARNLSDILTSSIDTVVSSPPYGSSGESRDKTALFERIAADPKSARAGRKSVPHTAEAYSKNPDNIGNLKVGSVDAEVTSPPFADSFKHNNQDPEKRLAKLIEVEKAGVAKGRKRAMSSIEELRFELARQDGGYSESKDNIGNLRFVDAEVTSPPYNERYAYKDPEASQKDDPTANKNGRIHRPYSQDPNNIGNLSPGKVDDIIVSPPYEQSEAFLDTDFLKKITDEQDERVRLGLQKGHPRGSKARTLKYKAGAHASQGHSQSEGAEAEYLDRTEKGRIEHPDSIGKLKRETYMQAMERVYCEMFKVLKPGGLAVVVVKPFTRDKKVVDLPWLSWVLLERAGFQLHDLAKLYLKSMSFWRTIQYRKHPGQLQIRHEYAIVCRKANA